MDSDGGMTDGRASEERKRSLERRTAIAEANGERVSKAKVIPAM